MLGAAVAVERLLGLARGPRTRCGALAWFGVVQLTWILSLAMFRADRVADGWQILANAVGGVASPLRLCALPGDNDLIRAGWGFLLPIVALHGRAWLTQRHGVRRPSPLEKAVYAGAMLAAVLTLYSTTRQFIYFQF
jgi:hypothetical protein